MSTAVMRERMSDTSPLVKARMAGVFWLMTALAGTVALMSRARGLGMAANTVAIVCYVVATLLVYQLLKPVSRSLSLAAALASIAGCANGVFVMFLGAPPQVARLSTLGFGIHCFLVGCLILGSSFLPRAVGALMTLAGLGWLTLGSAMLLAPALGRTLSPYLMGLGILGEVSLTLWLLVMGVNVQRWNEQAGPTRGRS